MRHDPDALMLFAAGFGTRMGALTASRPKPLIEVAGRTLLDHALDVADTARIPRKVVNLHYLGDQIAAHLSARTDVKLSWEHQGILDTGGGLRQALPLLGSGAVYTLNSDAIWSGENPLCQLRAGWDPASMSCLLLLLHIDEVAGRAGNGDFGLDPKGRITRGGPFVYLGAQILDVEPVHVIKDAAFSLNRVWDDLICQGRAYGLVHKGGWCDVGHPGGIAAAEELLRADKKNPRDV